MPSKQDIKDAAKMISDVARLRADYDRAVERIAELEDEVERLENQVKIKDEVSASTKRFRESLRNALDLPKAGDKAMLSEISRLRADLARVTEERRYWRNEAKGIDSRLGTRIREMEARIKRARQVARRYQKLGGNEEVAIAAEVIEALEADDE